MVSAFYFDKGDFAPSQQDALVLEEAALGRRKAVLLAVCDGIGGLPEGAYASAYVTMRIREWFYRDCLRLMKWKSSGKRIERDCTGMLYDCNRYLTIYGKEHGIRLGTTVTMAVLESRDSFWLSVFPRPVKYRIFHAGDSRAYLLDKKCRRLTRDDSFEGRGLYRCIGSFPWQGIQKRRGYLRAGAKMLICSDGFWRKPEPWEMAESLGRKKEPRLFRHRELTEAQLAKRLKKLGQAGRERGEKDNQAAVCCAGTEN